MFSQSCYNEFTISLLESKKFTLHFINIECPRLIFGTDCIKLFSIASIEYAEEYAMTLGKIREQQI